MVNMNMNEDKNKSSEHYGKTEREKIKQISNIHFHRTWLEFRQQNRDKIQTIVKFGNSCCVLLFRFLTLLRFVFVSFLRILSEMMIIGHLGPSIPISMSSRQTRKFCPSLLFSNLNNEPIIDFHSHPIGNGRRLFFSGNVLL